MLKSLNFSELDGYTRYLRPWLRAQVQEIAGSEHEVGLSLYGPAGRLWLWWDLQVARPLCVLLTSPPRHRKKVKPLHLFLRAHLVGARLEDVWVESQWGRVLCLRFQKGEQSVQLEARLFPHGANLLVRTADKKLSWRRPQPLVANPASPGSEKARSVEEIRAAYLEMRRGSKAQPAVKDEVKRLKSDLEKKRRALAKVREGLEEASLQTLQAAGEWLKAEGANCFPQAIPPEYREWVDGAASLSENMESIFATLKKQRGKLEGRRERARLLSEEVAALERRLENPLEVERGASKGDKTLPPKTLLQVSQSKGRKKVLASGAVALMGKTAADNMALLRAARPWDLWLHLRDFPSAHVILQLNKRQKVGDAELIQVGQWLAAETFGRKADLYRGEKIEIMVCEKRHVRPIKGAGLGRVQYANERTLVFQFVG